MSNRCAIMLMLILGACETEETFSAAFLAGTYDAGPANFTVVDTQTIDVIAHGGSLRMILNSNGTTAGQLVIPSSVTGGAALDASMVGTFTVTGSTVRFVQAADTFIRDLVFTVVEQGPNVGLTATGTFSGTTVHVNVSRGGVLLPN